MIDTFNLYMDEFEDDLGGGDEAFADVQFRIVPASEDEGNAEENAVLAGLDIYDLLELRNAVQETLDVIVTAALDPAFLEQMERDLSEMEQ
jgi:hypothetical protein